MTLEFHPLSCLCYDCQHDNEDRRDYDYDSGKALARRHRPYNVLFDGDVIYE